MWDPLNNEQKFLFFSCTIFDAHLSLLVQLASDQQYLLVQVHALYTSNPYLSIYEAKCCVSALSLLDISENKTMWNKTGKFVFRDFLAKMESKSKKQCNLNNYLDLDENCTCQTGEWTMICTTLTFLKLAQESERVDNNLHSPNIWNLHERVGKWAMICTPLTSLKLAWESRQMDSDLHYPDISETCTGEWTSGQQFALPQHLWNWHGRVVKWTIVCTPSTSLKLAQESSWVLISNTEAEKREGTLLYWHCVWHFIAARNKISIPVAYCHVNFWLWIKTKTLFTFCKSTIIKIIFYYMYSMYIQSL